MWNYPSKRDLEKVPDLYSTENVKLEDKVIYQHFFIFNSDWYIAEISHEDYNLMFGYCILNGDKEMAEWGYVSLKELSSINIKGFEVDRDLYWQPKSFKNLNI
jgi:hypothetical protein